MSKKTKENKMNTSIIDGNISIDCSGNKITFFPVSKGIKLNLEMRNKSSDSIILIRAYEDTDPKNYNYLIVFNPLEETNKKSYVGKNEKIVKTGSNWSFYSAWTKSELVDYVV